MDNEQIKKQLDIKEGTITFWVKENKVIWNDGKVYPLFELSEGGNSIFIIKDSDNKLKFFHVFLGKGRTDVELDVSSLSNTERHFIAATWSLSKKEIALYVDGDKLQNFSPINYA